MISFAEKHPELLPEWSWKNELAPDEVSFGSNKKVLWQGACGHEWEAAVKNRGNNHGCPYCSGNKVLIGFNDFASCFPDLAEEWSDKNDPLRPENYTKRSTHSAWWKCPECGHQWKARIADRAEGHGCPVCAGEKLVADVNSLAAVNPEIAIEWSARNSKMPDMVFPRSREMAWWKCKHCGHEWQAVIHTRVGGRKCPECEAGRRKALREKNLLIRRETEQRRKEFPLELIRDYSKKAGLTYKYMDDNVIGIPLQFHYPEVSSAIEISLQGHRQAYKYERAKNWLCLNAGIRMIRILRPGNIEYDNCICISMKDDSEEAMNLAIVTAFTQLGVTVGVDLGQDKALMMK